MRHGPSRWPECGIACRCLDVGFVDSSWRPRENSSMIYHLIPELEAFSAVRGGALARDVANIMRWNPTDMVVCIDADETWGLPPERALVIPALRSFNRLKAKRFLPLWFTTPLLRRIFQPLISILKQGDIVWCHNQLVFSAALQGDIRAKGAKLAHHFHDGHAPHSARAALNALKPDSSIFISDFLRKHWLAMFPSLTNTSVVPNGGDPELFYPAPPDAPRESPTIKILYVGRLHPEKGGHVLIDAMRILHERKVDAVCRMVGSSFSGGSKPTPYVQNLLDTAPPNVKFEGHRSGKLIAEEYRKSDILCCPSIWQEPFGNVNVEGMASGTPVVASNVGGIPEIGAEGGIILVEPNSPVAIADALQRLVEDKDLRAKLGQEGVRSFHKRFTWESVCNQYNEILDKL
jgi:glycosyltransferase involved in cell wall biosynthesis